MALLEATAIRAYAQALRDFIAMTAEASQSRRPIWSDPILAARGEKLLQAIRDCRKQSFKAGVFAGETVDRMNMRQFICLEVCANHRAWEGLHDPEWAHRTVAGQLDAYLAWLAALAVAAET